METLLKETVSELILKSKNWMDKKKETVSRRGLIELGIVRCLPFCVLYISQSFQNKLKWQDFYPKKEN